MRSRIRLGLVVSPLLVAGLCFGGCGSNDIDSGWTAHELGTRAVFRDVFFIDERRGWIVGGGHDIEGGILGRTTDGGRSWSFTSRIARPHRHASTFHLNSVWFLDERNGFIAGDGFTLLRTVDGGDHWHGVLQEPRVWAHLQDLAFVDDRHGWAIGSGGLVRTVNGGADWKAVRGEPTRGRAVHFIDVNRGWLVGSGGLIRTSVDGGESWTTVVGAATGRANLRSIDFVDERLGWAVGDGGTILGTTDGGASWQARPSGVEDTLMDVAFVDASLGWAVGFERRGGSSVILRTSDGGLTWSEDLRIPAEAASALFVLDAEHAWAVGEQQRRGPDDGSQKLLRYDPSVVDRE